MLQRITLALLALLATLTTAGPVLAHDHCDDPADPLCVPKGVVVGDDDRGSGRLKSRDEFPDKRCAPGEDGGVNCTE
jgi:uncharacterized protein (DUF779 family)